MLADQREKKQQFVPTTLHTVELFDFLVRSRREVLSSADVARDVECDDDVPLSEVTVSSGVRVPTRVELSHLHIELFQMNLKTEPGLLCLLV